MDQLVERQLVLHEFKAAGYQMPEGVIDNEVRDRIHSRFGDRAKLTKTLQAQGLTFEKFRNDVRDQIIVEALRGKNISAEVIVSPHKIEAYYLDHKDDFKLDDQVKLRMIALKKSADSDAEQTRALANEIVAKLKDGATFEEMAAVYSQGSQRGQGGDWGWVERSVLRKELAEPAFTIIPGSNSDVIETSDSCYIMRVEEKKPSHVKPLSDVRDEIEKVLLTKERARLEKKWVEKLKRKTFVRYF